MSPAVASDLPRFLEEERRKVDAALDRLLPPETSEPAALHKAMRYSVLGGGKRLRPILVRAACAACGGDPDRAMNAACSLEMIHTYSLIHDDLPAMDDDDLRRGRPTCHKVFGEALAILAGDALLTFAFEVLARPVAGEGLALTLVREAAEAAGTLGMVGGQVLDLQSEGGTPTAAAVEAIHRRKTAALIRASVRMGGLLAGTDDRLLGALTRFGESVGLAFQIADDVLDETSDAATLGKATKKDADRGKLTYPRAVGLEASTARARALAAQAVEAIADLPAPRRLRELAELLVERKA
ncbi:MAG: polyprenyl synthetase family protein [Planctomycetales bacterium]|nr:polyprenyl synthetase family protein [Planctomycetales bacterium]